MHVESSLKDLTLNDCLPVVDNSQAESRLFDNMGGLGLILEIMPFPSVMWFP